MSKKFDYVFYNKYMKLLCVNNVSFKKPLNAVKTGLTALLVCTPASVGDSFCKVTTKTFEPKAKVVLTKSLTQGLEVIEDINCRGGATHSFSETAVKKLKSIIASLDNKTYVFPIDTALHPYIPSTGQFGSIRPAGRAHLGVDIYPRLYGRKPKTPVAVVSATDGIVVSVKKSPEYDPKNLIANNIKILGTDGKIYSYDHLGRPEDYKNTKYTPLKKLGEVVHSGDTLGTVGKTGETDVWHLHLGVEDLDEKAKQLKNPQWQKLFKHHSVYATPRGQVDPLDSCKAGEIAKILNQYKTDKGPKVDYIDKL